MRSGDLNQRVTIQRRQTWAGKWGPKGSWATVATVWASVLGSKGTEKAADKGVDSATPYTVRMRYRSDVTSTDKFIWRGRVLDLVSVVDADGHRRELVCECVMNGDGKQAA